MRNDTLNKMFGIEANTVVIDATPTEIMPVEGTLVPDSVPPATDDALVQLDTDVQYAREVVREGIDQIREATKSAILLAQSGDSPRAFEVVGNMLTAMVNANKELVNLHKAKEETTSVYRNRVHGADAKGGVTIEKAVFIGRAADLLRELRSLSKPTDETTDDTPE